MLGEESLVAATDVWEFFLEIPGWGGRWEICGLVSVEWLLSSGVVETPKPSHFCPCGVGKNWGGGVRANHVTRSRPTAQNRS